MEGKGRGGGLGAFLPPLPMYYFLTLFMFRECVNYVMSFMSSTEGIGRTETRPLPGNPNDDSRREGAAAIKRRLWEPNRLIKGRRREQILKRTVFGSHEPA